MQGPVEVRSSQALRVCASVFLSNAITVHTSDFRCSFPNQVSQVNKTKRGLYVYQA